MQEILTIKCLALTMAFRCTYLNLCRIIYRIPNHWYSEISALCMYLHIIESVLVSIIVLNWLWNVNFEWINGAIYMYFCCCTCFGIKNINVTTRFDQIHQIFHKILSINIILKSIKGHNSVEKFGKIMCISHNLDHIYQCINKMLSKSIRYF